MTKSHMDPIGFFSDPEKRDVPSKNRKNMDTLRFQTSKWIEMGCNGKFSRTFDGPELQFFMAILRFSCIVHGKNVWQTIGICGTCVA